MAIKVRHLITESSGKAKGLALNTAGSEVALLTGGQGLVDPSEQANGYGGNLLTVSVKNGNTTTVRRVKVYLLASGDSVADASLIIDENIPANGMLLYQPRRPRKYKSAAVVKASQDTGTDCLAWAEALENYSG